MTEQDIAQVILGESTAIRKVRRAILKLAATPISVLILGPTGAGKELVAQALHTGSGRRGRFVPVNSAAISDSLCEAELFGYVRGAFTGAIRDHDGYLAEAERGTLFLDEVESMSSAMQSKLLRAVETGVFRPGGAAADRQSEFRVVAAANEDQRSGALRHFLRQDLLFRLARAVIEVPGLDERVDDIPVLVRHFARMQGAELAREVAFSDAAMRLLQSRQWPGNVRELQSAVARAIAFCGASVITSDDLRPFLESPGQVGIEADAFDPIKANLLRALQRGENDTLRAAMLLGVHRSTIYRQMRRFGIARPRFNGRGALEPVVE